MHIAEFSSTSLALDRRRDLRRAGLFLLMFGAPFFLAGVVTMALGTVRAKPTVISCDRANSVQVTCELYVPTLMGHRRQTIPAGQLQSARTDTYEDSDEMQQHRLILHTTTEEISIYTGSSLSEIEEQAGRLNAFLNTSATMSLVVSAPGTDERRFAYPSGLAFLLASMGIWSLPWRKKMPIRCEFDKRRGEVRVQYFLRRQHPTYSLVDIQTAEIIETVDDEDRPWLNLVLTLKSGEVVSLPLSSDPLSSDPHGAVGIGQNPIAAVRDFLSASP